MSVFADYKNMVTAMTPQGIHERNRAELSLLAAGTGIGTVRIDLAGFAFRNHVSYEWGKHNRTEN
jgi:hypothetical protein